ncbi:primosomal protein DnaI [Lactobacillus xylocopicola]|uniref:Primosomal protein DnaI n=1 Tax=Lactobacillus xylocopicola TaxID=2976676 RepID=A0ABM8BHI3_9LACO|nr:primosomal protein DnaI [Lactobacillus xylocopicola]BDR60744.1 primosomal protein DnaI [Lactobacillus xylocopicola]
MQSIGDFMDKNIASLAQKENPAAIREQVLAEPKVRAFLKAHADQITPDMIEKSLSNLYEFCMQQHKQDPVTRDYQPQLILNSNAIDLQYAPKASKIAHDSELKARKNVSLINLPQSLHEVSLSELEVTKGRTDALAEIRQFLAKYQENVHQKGLYLYGNFGIGKTYMLAGLANQLAAWNKKVVFLHVPTFIATLSSHFGDNSLPDELQRISNCDVLILDDIGAETLSQWSRDEVLAVILQSRMDNVLPTFFSANMAMDDLEEHFKETKNALDPVKAARLLERVRTLATEVTVSGQNRRR